MEYFLATLADIIFVLQLVPIYYNTSIIYKQLVIGGYNTFKFPK